MLLGPGLMYFLACFDTLLEAERAPNPKGFSPYRGDSASAGARHPSWPAAFTLPARWDDAENRARKGRYPSSESARVLVDQYFVDSLAVVFYVGVEPDRAVWPGAGVHVHDVGAGTAVDGVPGSPSATSIVSLPVRLERLRELLTVSMPCSPLIRVITWLAPVHGVAHLVPMYRLLVLLGTIMLTTKTAFLAVIGSTAHLLIPLLSFTVQRGWRRHSRSRCPAGRGSSRSPLDHCVKTRNGGRCRVSSSLCPQGRATRPLCG